MHNKIAFGSILMIWLAKCGGGQVQQTTTTRCFVDDKEYTGNNMPQGKNE
jgi:hypothetical protein